MTRLTSPVSHNPVQNSRSLLARDGGAKRHRVSADDSAYVAVREDRKDVRRAYALPPPASRGAGPAGKLGHATRQGQVDDSQCVANNLTVTYSSCGGTAPPDYQCQEANIVDGSGAAAGGMALSIFCDDGAPLAGDFAYGWSALTDIVCSNLPYRNLSQRLVSTSMEGNFGTCTSVSLWVVADNISAAVQQQWNAVLQSNYQFNVGPQQGLPDPCSTVVDSPTRQCTFGYINNTWTSPAPTILLDTTCPNAPSMGRALSLNLSAQLVGIVTSLLPLLSSKVSGAVVGANFTLPLNECSTFAQVAVPAPLLPVIAPFWEQTVLNGSNAAIWNVSASSSSSSSSTGAANGSAIAATSSSAGAANGGEGCSRYDLRLLLLLFALLIVPLGFEAA